MAGKLMTKSQFISLIAEKNGMTKAAAGAVLDSIVSTAIAETKKRSVRVSRNRQGGEGAPQGADGTESADRRCHKDCCKDRG